MPHYKGALYVFKSLQNRTTTVYDKYGLGEYGRYDEPFTEFVWTISDSTKNVIGYDCFMAETDYHGRHWTVWFTPEIPLQDGPWKLCGLPGLILEATDSTDQHSFIATGIENSNQEIYPIYEPRKYDKMKRIDMLKAYSDYQKNAGATSRILIMDTPDGSKVNMDAPKQRKANSQNIDFLETDYH
ncbi:GLPGLI family protein [uncultured Duncaniella sp.]|uniref:GLPGLI family protein n=1 Tax=uncultured Duncaniella sp. TaxID=2768039 RepID=UPI00259D22DD|nr:GLPGLI family protein [uncultured Duncaniella sp.]